MSKKQCQTDLHVQSRDSRRVVVWGEPREKPDWDTYIAALLAYALREVKDDTEPEKKS
jgi:hypothetical protein